MEQNYPGYLANRRIVDEQIALAARERFVREDGVVYRIPVVFHVIYRDDAQNAPIQQQGK